MVVVVSNRVPVAKGAEEEFERRWKNRKWTVANHRGFIRTEVLRPVKADHYVVVTHWQTMKDFEDWTNSDAFMESLARTLLRSSPSLDPASTRFTK